MPVRVRADPDIGVGRRNGELADALDDAFVGDATTAKVPKDEMLATQGAAEARLAVAGIAQPFYVSGSRTRRLCH